MALAPENGRIPYNAGQAEALRESEEPEGNKLMSPDVVCEAGRILSDSVGVNTVGRREVLGMLQRLNQ